MRIVVDQMPNCASDCYFYINGQYGRNPLCKIDGKTCDFKAEICEYERYPTERICNCHMLKEERKL